jgi:polyphosphate glucokinase
MTVTEDTPPPRTSTAPGTKSRATKKATPKRAPAKAAPAKAADGAGDAAGSRPATLAIDIGGTGLKASVLDAKGEMMAARVRVPTTYPLPPEGLVQALADLVQPLPTYDRVSAGFPGMIREGRVLTAPHFITKSGPGSAVVAELEKAWASYPLANALTARLERPTKVANDADLQGSAVVSGHGLELVITLGTGFGTAVFYQGQLLPHMEIAHQPFRKGETYDEHLGDAARKRVGVAKWSKRVRQAIENLHGLLYFDHLYIGGGNAKHLKADLGPKATRVDNSAGILGGIKLWERDTRQMAG